MNVKVMPNAVPINISSSSQSSPDLSSKPSNQSVEAVSQTSPKSGGTLKNDSYDAKGNREEVTEVEADRRMKSVIDQANERVKHTGNRQLAFSYNENTKRISIKVYDSLTKEIIKEIPPEKTIEMLERIYDLAGIMVDEKR